MNAKPPNSIGNDPFSTLGEPVPEPAKAETAPTEKPKPKPVAPTRKAPGTQPRGRKIYMPDELYQRLRLMAIQENATVSHVATQLLDDQVPRFTIRKAG